MASNEHWGVLGAETYELGPSTIIDGGLAVWLITKEQAEAKFSNSTNCNQIVADATGSTNTNMVSSLWPKVGNSDRFPDVVYLPHNEHSEQHIDTNEPTPISRNGNSQELPGMVTVTRHKQNHKHQSHT